MALVLAVARDAVRGVAGAAPSSRSRFRATTSRSTCPARSQIYRNQGENFQVSTAPGPDGIVRRIEVEANDERSTGDWAVFALANTTDQQIDRLIVAPHFRLVNSGLFWPDLGSSRIAAITPSEGFALDRQASPDADVFLVTLNPGAVVTFIAELASPNLPQVYLWEPEPYKDSVNSYTLFRGIVIGIAGLLALFLTILFVVKGTSMFPATAALSWAVLAYICVDFGFLNKVIEISPGNEQIWRAGTEVALAATFVVFLFAYLNLNRWHGHFSYGAFVWICGLLLIAGVAIIDPAVAAGIARLSFAATAIAGLGLIVCLGIRGYDRAIMLIPSWVMVLVWLTGVVDGDHRHARQRHRAAGARRRPDPDHPADRLHRHAARLCRRRAAPGPVQRPRAAGAGGCRLRRHRLGLGRAARPRRDQARRQPAARPGAEQPRRTGPQLAAGAASRRPRHASARRSTWCWNTGAAASARVSACAAPTATTTGSRCGRGRWSARTARSSAASARWST